jgi:hypothetical protein
MKRKSLLILIICLLPAAVWGLPVQVYLDSPTIFAGVGETFRVDLMADIPEPVLGWGLDIIYDPAILALQGMPVIRPPWWALPSKDGDGLAGYAFPNAVTGNNTLLATLTFKVLSSKSTSILAGMTTGDKGEGFPIFGLAGGFAEFEALPSRVNPVPEPATLLLMGCGLISIAGVKRRLKAKA